MTSSYSAFGCWVQYLAQGHDDKCGGMAVGTSVLLDSSKSLALKKYLYRGTRSVS